MHHHDCRSRANAVYAICLIACLSSVSVGQSYMLVDQMACVMSQVGEKGNADNWRLSGHLQLYTCTLTDAHCTTNVGLHIIRCHDIAI